MLVGVFEDVQQDIGLMEEININCIIIILSHPTSLYAALFPSEKKGSTYLIIVTDATDAVSVNFSGRCKFLLI